MARSAGTFAQLVSREEKYAIIKMPSGEVRKILSACKATIGSVGNSDHALEQSGKAGRSVGSDVVLAPVVFLKTRHHPMGGGEGKASEVTPGQPKAFILRG